MPQSDLTFTSLDGGQAAAHTAELHALHAEVYADPPYQQPDDEAAFAHRFLVRRRQPGFVLAEARHGDYLVGYAAGMPLRPSTSWWRGLTTPLPDEITTEHPGRTFTLIDLLVRASWRRQGIGRTLHDLLLANRPEERATLTVLPAALPAQTAFRQWGWRKIARTHTSNPPAPNTNTPMPSANTQAPNVSTPVSGTNRPTPGTNRPRPSANRPAAGTNRPVPGTNRPVPGTNRPVPGTNRPVPGASPPVFDVLLLPLPANTR